MKFRDKVASMEKLQIRVTFLGGDTIVNKWMSFALEKNVKELAISFKQRPMHAVKADFRTVTDFFC